MNTTIDNALIIINNSYIFYNELYLQLREAGTQIDKIKHLFDSVPVLVAKHSYDRLIALQRTQLNLADRVSEYLQLIRLGILGTGEKKMFCERYELIAAIQKLKEQIHKLGIALFKDKRVNKIL